MTFSLRRSRRSRTYSIVPQSPRAAALGFAVSCGAALVSACGDDDGAGSTATAGSGGSAGLAGNGGRAGSAGNAGASGNGSGGNAGGGGASSGPSGTISVLSADSALRGPTTGALRGDAVWVANGQLGGLFGGPAPVPPFTVVSVPVAGGAIASDVITLPNPDDFYPEGTAAADDGTLFVGSLSLGIIARIAAGSTTPDAEPFVAAGVAERGVVGIEVDEARNILWFCDSGPTAPVQGAALVGVSLTDAGGATPGAEVVRHVMPNPGASDAEDAGAQDADAGGATPSVGVASFCNDIILDPETQDILASDSNGGRIFRVPAANALTADSAEVWLSSSELMPPASGGGYGANGLDFVADTLITCVSNGTLFAIDPRSTNPAASLRSIQLSGGTLCGPDGLQSVPGSSNELIVIENGSCANPPGGDGDRVSKVTLDL
jgi:hypothetical protein